MERERERESCLTPHPPFASRITRVGDKNCSVEGHRCPNCRRRGRNHIHGTCRQGRRHVFFPTMEKPPLQPHAPSFRSLSFFLLSWDRLLPTPVIQILDSSYMVDRMTCTRSWSISEDSLRRYVLHASESCVQELLSASESGRVEGKESWKVLALDEGVEISRRRTGSLHVFRSRWLLQSVSPRQFMTVANAIDAAKQWDPNLAETEYIKDIGDNLSIIRLRFGEDSKPLFKNREFIVYERRETMDDGTLVVAVASLPKEIAAGLLPEKSKSIRGLLLQSGWVVEKTEESSCMVTYVVQLDPAGWLPRCFVNRLNTKLVMIIKNLRKIAQGCPING